MTETFKSQQEIYAFISQPHRPMVVNKHGVLAGFEEDGALFQITPQGSNATILGFIFYNPEAWRPYVKPPKSLTFDEAVKCNNKLKVDLPEGYQLWGVRRLVRGDGWTSEELTFLDLAERRGWAITEVTE